MKKNNAEEILTVVEAKIKELENWYRGRLRIYNVCQELSIFDWWNEYLSVSQLKDMRKFLREAIKLGYTGYVCFKVGATGCANGMWAHKNETEDGYSPDGECLYKSFSPEYNYWQVKTAEGKWIPNDKYDSIKTIKQLEELINNL